MKQGKGKTLTRVRQVEGEGQFEVIRKMEAVRKEAGGKCKWLP